jgi:hypothetical protein
MQELKHDFTKPNHMVALLKQENKIFKPNVMHQSTSLGHPYSNKAKDKGKTLIGLKEQVEDKEMTQKNLVHFIGVEIEEDKDYWLGRVNKYFEKILERANRDTKLQRNMAIHYFTRNMICKIRLKNMKKRLRKSLKKLKRRDSLDIFYYESLIV